MTLLQHQIDTSNFRANISDIATSSPELSSALDLLKGTGIDINTVDSDLLDILAQQVTDKNLDDVYYIYMWNYCSGNYKSTGSSGNKTNDRGPVEIKTCSPRKPKYYFNPVEVWGLNDTEVVGKNADDFLPKEVDKALNAYRTASAWMYVAYVIAFVATASSIVVGLFAICSRVGSLFTTIVSSVSYISHPLM